MKHIFATLLFSCGFILHAFAQAPVVAEKEISFKKQKVNSFSAVYNGVPESDLQAATEFWMQKNLGGKKTKTSGFQGYTGARWNDLDYGAPLEVYYKVDGNKKNSNLTLIVLNASQQPLSSANQAQAGGKLYTFFNELNTEVAEYQRMQKINALQSTLNQQEAAQQKLDKKNSDLKKQRERLDADIAANEKEAAELNNQINTTKESLKEFNR